MMQPVEIRFTLAGELDKEINKVKKSISGIDDTTKKTAAGANSHLNKIGTNGGKIGKSFASGFSSFLNPATLGVSALSAMLLKIGKDAYTFSKDFDAGMSEVATISDAVKEDFDGISDSVLNLSTMPIKDTGVELSKAYYQIVSAGYDGAEGLKLLEVSAKAATGGVTDTLTAADGLTTVMNAWGASINDVDKISDQMFTTVKLGKTTIGELSSNVAKAAPLASSMGVGFNEIFAATASITKQGTPTAEAFTQMRAALTAMNGVLGDGWAKTMTFQEGLAKVREMSGGSQIALKKLLGTDEAVSATLALTGDKAAGAAADLEAMGKSAGASTAAFNTMSDNADIIWNQFGNQFNLAMKNVGKGVLEASKGLGKFLTASLFMSDQLGDDFEQVGDNVDSFSERMKVLKNEGNGFFGALTGAMLKNNTTVQSIVDAEKEEAKKTAEEIQAINDEFSRMKAAGASPEELTAFKQNLSDRYTAIQESQDNELQAANKHSRQMSRTAYMTLGLVNDGGKASRNAKDVKDKADEAKKLVDAVNQLTVIDPLQPGNSIVENTRKTINELEKELKELEGKSGSFGNASDESLNIDKIKAKTEEIKAAWQEVRDVRAKALGMDGEESTPLMTGKSVSVTATSEKDLVAELAPMKKLTAEEKKQLDMLKESVDLETKQQVAREVRQENLEDMGVALEDTSYLTGQMADLAGNFDDNLGESLDTMSDLAGQGASLMSSLASGDWVGAIGTGIGIISTMFETISGSSEAELAAQEAINEAAIELNEILYERISLLVDAGLITEYEGAVSEIDNLTAKMDLTTAKLEDFYHFFYVNGKRTAYSFSELMNTIYGEGWTTTDLVEATSDLAAFSDKLRELGINDYASAPLSGYSYIDENSFSSAVNDVIELQSQINDLDESASDIFLGFTADDLATTVSDGITQGLELAEDGLGDYTDSFGGLLRSMFESTLSTALNGDKLEAIMAKYKDAWGDGSMSDDELTDLQTMYSEMVQGGQDLWDTFQPILDEFEDAADATTDSALSGAINGITQDQAGALEGTTNAMLYKMVDLGNIQMQQLEVQQLIEEHTKSSANNLDDIAIDFENLRKTQGEMAKSLKTIAENQTSGGFSI